MNLLRQLALIAILGFTFDVSAANVPRVMGEPARTPEKSHVNPAWKHAEAHLRATVVTLKTIAPDRIDTAKRGNSAGKTRKAQQIGVTRDLAFEIDGARFDGALKWATTADGGKSASFRLVSPGARGLRAAMTVAGLPDNAELRFAGSANDAVSNALASGTEAKTLLDRDKRYWTPFTTGEAQVIEIYVPAGVNVAAIRIEISQLSHIFASAELKFGDTKVSKPCNVDTICRPQTPSFVNAKNSVAQLLFTSNCDPDDATRLTSCICTGTLLNDDDSATQIPYVYSATHCIGTQTEANTVNTLWFKEAPSCGAGVSGMNQTLVTGGANLLFTNADSDAMLMRLNRAPPAGAFFSGWDAATVTAGTNVTGIHHPSDDLKKSSDGQILGFNSINGSISQLIRVGWTSGTTEGGSSGSGIFTVTNDQYFLRGGLEGGSAECLNSGSLSNPDNRDYYSRFDETFPSIKQFLQSATNYSDLWWAGEAENGWGMSVQQHGSTQFNALYVYDDLGRPTWYVMSGVLTTTNPPTVSGTIYQPTSTPLNNYDPTGFNAAAAAGRLNAPGTARITYTGNSTARLEYTINGISGSKNMSRQVFGGLTAPFDVGDMWWGGQSQNGWGISLIAHEGIVFGAWYTYGPNGQPTWYVLSRGTWSGNTVTGALYSTTGSRWLGATFPPIRSQDILEVGTLTLNFANANAATMTYRFTAGPFAGTQQTKPLVRQEY